MSRQKIRQYKRSTRPSSLLPQAFPEGSPVYPSYPADHAVSSVFKAHLDGDFIISTSWISTSSS